MYYNSYSPNYNKNLVQNYSKYSSVPNNYLQMIVALQNCSQSLLECDLQGCRNDLIVWQNSTFKMHYFYSSYVNEIVMDTIL